MDYYQTQYQLLKGRTLAERAVERLKLQTHPELATGPMMNPWERVRGFFGLHALGRGRPERDAALARRRRLPLADPGGARARLAAREPALPRLRPAGGGRRGEHARAALHRAVARAALHDLDRGDGLALGSAQGAAGQGRGRRAGAAGVPRARGARRAGVARGARRPEARDAERRRARGAHRADRQGDALQPDRLARPGTDRELPARAGLAARCRRSRPSSARCRRRRPGSPTRSATATPTWCACAARSARPRRRSGPRCATSRARRRATTARRSRASRASRRASRR